MAKEKSPPLLFVHEVALSERCITTVQVGEVGVDKRVTREEYTSDLYIDTAGCKECLLNKPRRKLCVPWFSHGRIFPATQRDLAECNRKFSGESS